MKTHTWVLLAALLIGLFVRTYQFKDRFYYAHDNDLASWVVRDILLNRHPRLSGQLTTTPGIFIGSLFYYALIPLYVVGRMDPLYTVGFSWFIGGFSIFSIYWVFSKLFSPKTAGIGSLLYAVSFAISQTEREVVPTTPAMLWSIWFLYAVNLLYAGHKRSLWLLAVLWALIWHVNLALVLLTPLVLIGIVIRPYPLKSLFPALILFLALSTPLAFFEFRHDFQQTRALVTSLEGKSAQLVGTRLGKFNRTLFVASQNATSLLIGKSTQYPIYIIPVGLLMSGIWLVWRHKINPAMGAVYLAWLLLYLVFFTFHPINLSEYYLNGINILWLFLFSVTLSQLSKFLGISLITILIVHNLYLFVHSPINGNNYTTKTNLVKFVSSDSQLHNYPCVSVSYITDPGNEFGYRHLFWLENLSVNRPSSGSPVYTIVFPHAKVNHLDKTFGALGLILPDYSRYSPSAVSASCKNTNDNLTDPMFGFTN